MPTCRVGICAFLVLAAAIRIAVGSPVAFYPTLEALLKDLHEGSIVQNGLGDDFTNILSEVQSEQFSNALTRAFLRRLKHTSIPEHKLLVCTNALGRGVTIYLAYSNSPTNASAINLLRECVGWYIDARPHHSLAYVKDSMSELAAPTPQPLLFATEEKLVRLYHIPPGWLKHSLTNDFYYVMDKPLAWVYNTSGAVTRECQDAQEFDPKVRPIIDAVRETVWKAYNGRRPHSVEYYHKVKDLLKENYGIAWQSPLDLNPGLIIDF